VAGACVVVGGPDTNGLDFTYFVEQDFDPDIGNAGSSGSDPADGLQIVDLDGHVLDNVIYGRNNGSGITDEDGETPAPDVGDAAPDKTIERNSSLGWVVDVTPNPEDCAAISK